MGIFNKLFKNKKYSSSDRRRLTDDEGAYSFRDMDGSFPQHNEMDPNAEEHPNNDHAPQQETTAFDFDYSFPILSKAASTQRADGIAAEDLNAWTTTNENPFPSMQRGNSTDIYHNHYSSNNNAAQAQHPPYQQQLPAFPDGPYPDSTDSELDVDANDHVIGVHLMAPPGDTTEDDSDDMFFGGGSSSNAKPVAATEQYTKNIPAAHSAAYTVASNNNAKNSHSNRTSKSPRTTSTSNASVPSSIVTSSQSSHSHSRHSHHYNYNSNRSVSTNGSRHSRHSRRSHNKINRKYVEDDVSKNSEEETENNQWLMNGIEDALGPKGVTADMESLGGYSNRSGRGGTHSVGGNSYRSKHSHGNRSYGNRSARTSRSRRSRKSYSSYKQQQPVLSSSSYHGGSYYNSNEGGRADDYSRGSGASGGHASYYSNQSKYSRGQSSMVSTSTKSVMKDVMRLEKQLAKVGYSNASIGENNAGGNQSVASRTSRRSTRSRSSKSKSHSRSLHHHNSHHSQQHEQTIDVVAPPGKLGVILGNRSPSTGGTVVSEVRSTSVLAGMIQPGDLMIAVDGQDVRQFSVTEVTAVMARKYEYERTLTILRRKADYPDMNQLSLHGGYNNNNVGETGSLGGTSYQSGYSYGHSSYR